MPEPITASKLRADVYRIIDAVLETGEPVDVERKGRVVRLIAVEFDPPKRRDLSKLTPHPGAVTGDPGDLVDVSWEHEWRP